MNKQKIKRILFVSILCFILIFYFQISWLDQAMTTLKQNEEKLILRGLNQAIQYIDPGDRVTELLKAKVIYNVDTNDIELRYLLRDKIKSAFELMKIDESFELFVIDGKDVLLMREFSSIDEINFDYFATRFQFNVFALASVKLAIKVANQQKPTLPAELILPIMFIVILLLLFTYLMKYSFDQEKLKQMQTDFTNNMLHELKTPVFSISLAIKAIRERFRDTLTEKHKTYLDIIETENNTQKENINSVLEIALLESDQFKLQKEQITLQTILEKVIHQFEELYEISIEKNFPASDIVIEANQQHLQNVITNLLDNAVKYSSTNENITISIQLIPNRVEIKIRDHGIGIAADNLNHLYNKFYRVSTEDRHDIKGFGLGLSYVKMVVDLHQWTIDIQSELTKGTEVTIGIPC